MSRPSPHPWKDPLPSWGAVVIFDIDGVLADMSPHEHYLQAERSRDKNWKAFHKAYSRARSIKVGVHTAREIREELGLFVAYSTTRPEVAASRTYEWMEKRGLPSAPILFRHLIKDGPRPSVEVKVRHWWQWVDRYPTNPVLGWIEDDPAALQALRKQGCPAWGPQELKRAAKAHGSLLAALQAGPIPLEERQELSRQAYPIWAEKEEKFQAKRQLWWQEERERRRQRSAQGSRKGRPRRQ